MTTLGELTQEISRRKSLVAIKTMLLQHLEELYTSNDAGPPECVLSTLDGGRVSDRHITEYREQLEQEIEESLDEIERLEGTKLPVIVPKLLAGEDPEDPEDPDPKAADAEQDEEDGIPEKVRASRRDESSEPVTEGEVDNSDGDSDDDEAGDEDEEDGQPNAQAS